MKPKQELNDNGENGIGCGIIFSKRKEGIHVHVVSEKPMLHWCASNANFVYKVPKAHQIIVCV
jgi:hypothetical protein